MKFNDFNPAVDKKMLVLLAGITWCCIGIMLINFAASWLEHSENKKLFYAVGFISALPIVHFGFMKIVDKNLDRLLPLTEKKCVFSFITWKSYIIVLVMVSLGIGLRHSPIPKNYLSVLYNAIGLALILSGLRYIKFFFKLVRVKTS